MKVKYDVQEFSVSVGDEVVRLNSKIFLKTGVEDTPKRRKQLLETHAKIAKLFEEYKDPSITNFNLLNKRLTTLNFKLQGLWGFPEDAQRHTYWYYVPGCVCPKMDNQDMLGTPYRIYSQGCPIHQTNIEAIKCQPQP